MSEPLSRNAPAGMIRIGDLLMPRRHGLVEVRKLTCIHGHKIKLRGRQWEISVPCTERLAPDYRIECGAQVLLFGFRPALDEAVVWMMDVSSDEEEMIAREGLGLRDVMERFSVSVPAIPYAERHRLPPAQQMQNRRGR